MKSYGRQTISEEDIQSVVEVLKSDMLTQGPAIALAERDISSKLNVRYCSLVNSATSALHLTLLALDIGPQSTVWTVSNTFLASANAPRYCGASVCFCDIDADTLNIDVKAMRRALEKSRESSSLPDAVIVVHFAGSSCDMRELHNLSKEFNFKLIEDASHAIGGKYLGNYIGNCAYSDACVFSFHPVKIITSGEGGAITTNCDEVAHRVTLLRSHGVSRDQLTYSWEYEQNILGYNYRMSDINAALLRSQLSRLDEFVEKRNFLAGIYRAGFTDSKIGVQEIPKENLSAYHLFTVSLPIDTLKKKEHFKSFLSENGIGTQVHYIPVHTQQFHVDAQRLSDLGNTERNYVRTLSLPLYPELSEEEVHYILEQIKGYNFG